MEINVEDKLNRKNILQILKAENNRIFVSKDKKN